MPKFKKILLTTVAFVALPASSAFAYIESDDYECPPTVLCAEEAKDEEKDNKKVLEIPPVSSTTDGGAAPTPLDKILSSPVTPATTWINGKQHYGVKVTIRF